MFSSNTNGHADKYELKTCGSGFSGGGGWELGAIAAGLTPVFGVEADPREPKVSSQVADLYELNIGATAIRTDMREVETVLGQMLLLLAGRQLDVAFFSPPCQANSRARRKSLPARGDEGVGVVVGEYVRALSPKIVFLENVPDYRDTIFFRHIVTWLRNELGYHVQYNIINTADYGVPQTRHRLIMVATRPDMPPFEWPGSTHHDGDYVPATLWGDELLPWNGWLRAIEGLLPSLPEDKFADWQLARLPETLTATTLVASTSADLVMRPADQPASTVMASVGNKGIAPRCFLIPGDNTSNTTVLPEDKPMVTIQTRTPAQCPHRAYLVPSDNPNQERGRGFRTDQEPAPTITKSGTHASPKAFVIDDTCSPEGNNYPVPVRAGGEPIPALKPSQLEEVTHAFLISGNGNTNFKEAGPGCGVRYDGQPSKTIASSDSQAHRAFIVSQPNSNGVSLVEMASPAQSANRAYLKEGRVVRLTLLALARLQTFPDAYKWSGRKRVDCRIVGDAVPPLLSYVFVQAYLKTLAKTKVQVMAMAELQSSNHFMVALERAATATTARAVS